MGSKVLVLVVSAGLFGCAASHDHRNIQDDVAQTSEGLSHVGNPYVGSLLFFSPFPGTQSNGRACVTCHVAEDAFQLTPAHVEARWQALQQRKRHHPDADDPLFRAIDADDGAVDFTLLRQHALVRVVIPLPIGADGSKLVWPVDDPDAESVELFRATPTILDTAVTAPYQYDSRFATLQAQALGALQGHAEIQVQPKPRFLNDVAAFERTQFSSERVAALSQALEAGCEPAESAPALTADMQHGKRVFDRACAACHGGPRLNEPLAELASTAGIRDIFLSKPLPPFAADLPFAASPVQNKSRLWAVRVPGREEPELRESTDPGIALQTGKIEHFNEFDIPSLFGIANTAPYFRDNSATKLADVVRHYQLVFEAVRRVVPPEVPFPQRPDAIEDSDIAPLVAFLETL